MTFLWLYYCDYSWFMYDLTCIMIVSCSWNNHVVLLMAAAKKCYYFWWSPWLLKPLTKSPEEVIHLLSIVGFGGWPTILILSLMPYQVRSSHWIFTAHKVTHLVHHLITYMIMHHIIDKTHESLYNKVQYHTMWCAALARCTVLLIQ